LSKYSHDFYQCVGKYSGYIQTKILNAGSRPARIYKGCGTKKECASICYEALPSRLESNSHIWMPNLITNFLIEITFPWIWCLFVEVSSMFLTFYINCDVRWWPFRTEILQNKIYSRLRCSMLICPPNSSRRLGSASWHRYSRAISPTSSVDPWPIQQTCIHK